MGLAAVVCSSGATREALFCRHAQQDSRDECGNQHHDAGIHFQLNDTEQEYKQADKKDSNIGVFFKDLLQLFLADVSNLSPKGDRSAQGAFW